MRDDLSGLEISDNQLEQLTNLPVKNNLFLITNYLNIWKEKLLNKIKGSESPTAIFLGISGLLICYSLFNFIIHMFVDWINIPTWLLLILVSIWLGGLVQGILYMVWMIKNRFLDKNMTNSLKILINDVDRYNAIIKAIDINDQIENAGNPQVAITQRDKVIEALTITKLDLIRALKTERILRENKSFILSNSDLFTNNLATLTSMQVNEQATEHGRLLNEALQVALDVQYEMGKLQNQS